MRVCWNTVLWTRVVLRSYMCDAETLHYFFVLIYPLYLIQLNRHKQVLIYLGFASERVYRNQRFVYQIEEIHKTHIQHSTLFTSPFIGICHSCLCICSERLVCDDGLLHKRKFVQIHCLCTSLFHKGPAFRKLAQKDCTTHTPISEIVKVIELWTAGQWH